MLGWSVIVLNLRLFTKGSRLLLIFRRSVFGALNLTFHVVAHKLILLRSEFKISSRCMSLSSERYALVSSANSFVVDSRLRLISLI